MEQRKGKLEFACLPYSLCSLLSNLLCLVCLCALCGLLFNLYSSLLVSAASFACLPLAGFASEEEPAAVLPPVLILVTRVSLLTIVASRENQQRCLRFEQLTTSAERPRATGTVVSNPPPRFATAGGHSRTRVSVVPPVPTAKRRSPATDTMWAPRARRPNEPPHCRRKSPSRRRQFARRDFPNRRANRTRANHGFANPCRRCRRAAG